MTFDLPEVRTLDALLGTANLQPAVLDHNAAILRP
jgi:hypothetical protein